MHKGVIYKITSPSGKIYIGQTGNYKRRLNEYKNVRCKGQPKLHSSLMKYGVDNHSFEIVCRIEEPTREELKKAMNDVEVYMIRYYHSDVVGLNISAGGNSGAHYQITISGFTMNGECIKIYRSTEEAVAKEKKRVRIYNGRNLTIGGIIWVNDITKIPDFESIANRKRASKKVLQKKVYQYSKSGELLNEYDGVREAYRITGIDHRSIAAVANGSNPNRHTAGGFYWRYK